MKVGTFHGYMIVGLFLIVTMRSGIGMCGRTL